MSDAPQILGPHVQYAELNSRQQEIYNYQHVAALLADYGYVCIKLSDDWKGADFLADHFSAERTLRVQLKSCLTISKSYEGKGLHITFPVKGTWYLIDHDELVEIVMEITNVANTKSWQKAGLHWNHSPSQKLLARLKPHQLHRPAAATGTSSSGAARPKSESQKGSCYVRVGREVMGPMTQTRAAITAISAAAELDLVSMESLQGAVGAAALRAVPGEHRGPDLWESLARAHGLEANKQSQWAAEQPIFRDEQTWVVQKNVWGKARMLKLAKLSELTDGAVEIVFDEA